MPTQKKLLALDVFTYAVGKIKTYIAEQIGEIDFPDISMEKLSTADTGFFSTYQLTVDGTPVGDKINIPKDYVLKNVTIETVETADVPVAGYKVGQKYFDVEFNTKDQSETSTHTYLLAQELVDLYTQGTGISINANNVISVIAQDGTLDVGGISKADYVAFKGAADTFGAAETSDAPATTGNVTVTTTTVSIPSTDVGGTTTSAAITFKYKDTTYGNATASVDGGAAAAAGLMSGADKDNLEALNAAKPDYDAVVTTLGADVELATNSDIDAIFAE